MNDTPESPQPFMLSPQAAAKVAEWVPVISDGGDKWHILADSPQPFSLRDYLDNIEREIINHFLYASDGNKHATARALGISRQGLYKKIKRLGIEGEDAHDAAPVLEKAGRSTD